MATEAGTTLGLGVGVVVVFSVICIYQCESSSEFKYVSRFQPGVVLKRVFDKYRFAGLNQNVKEDPDAKRNVTQLITSKGYPCEQHTVQTKDGFLLGVQRIPHGVTRNGTGRKGVVFIQHGLLCSSSNWVVNLANESLGFILADEGYDVWLGNSRGNTYSRRHVKYSPDCDEFWDWSWDEMNLYDIPAFMNYVLNKTELAKKVKVFFALGPVTTVGHIDGPLRLFKDLSNWIIPDILTAHVNIGMGGDMVEMGVTGSEG
ncbi:hypothetical protein ScPMuIL_012140 [Solemya velum]